jgi:hypothetical protein
MRHVQVVGLRERVRMAIDGPVGEAQKLLDGAPGADEHARLSMLVNGWFRGIAGALEEIALEVDALRAERFEHVPAPASPQHNEELPAPAERRVEEGARTEEATDEATLAERARASREETAVLRKESPGGDGG